MRDIHVLLTYGEENDVAMACNEHEASNVNRNQDDAKIAILDGEHKA
jgi:hypothetical protein